jgi:hypothetical protein
MAVQEKQLCGQLQKLPPKVLFIHNPTQQPATKLRELAMQLKATGSALYCLCLVEPAAWSSQHRTKRKAPWLLTHEGEFLRILQNWSPNGEIKNNSPYAVADGLRRDA